MGYRQAFRKAFPYTIPVLTGYLFIGIAFGVMFAEKGLHEVTGLKWDNAAAKIRDIYQQVIDEAAARK